eukprot:COSAG04_NODE_100_length_26314_cov_36.469044_15_plen_88_part_00
MHPDRVAATEDIERRAAAAVTCLLTETVVYHRANPARGGQGKDLSHLQTGDNTVTLNAMALMLGPAREFVEETAQLAPGDYPSRAKL